MSSLLIALLNHLKQSASRKPHQRACRGGGYMTNIEFAYLVDLNLKVCNFLNDNSLNVYVMDMNVNDIYFLIHKLTYMYGVDIGPDLLKRAN